MKPLSEALIDLAARVQRLEDSAFIIREQKRTALHARREELEASIGGEVKEVEQTTPEARAAVRSWWLDTKASLEREFEVMRIDFNKWRTQLVEKDAERAARDAEHEAVAAITLASYCLDAAEWAVLRAELIRSEAGEPNRAAGRE